MATRQIYRPVKYMKYRKRRRRTSIRGTITVEFPTNVTCRLTISYRPFASMRVNVKDVISFKRFSRTRPEQIIICFFFYTVFNPFPIRELRMPRRVRQNKYYENSTRYLIEVLELIEGIGVCRERISLSFIFRP